MDNKGWDEEIAKRKTDRNLGYFEIRIVIKE